MTTFKARMNIIWSVSFFMKEHLTSIVRKNISYSSIVGCYRMRHDDKCALLVFDSVHSYGAAIYCPRLQVLHFI